MMSLHSNGTVTKTETGSRVRGISVAGPTMQFVVIWKTLEFGARKMVGCFWWGIIGHPRRRVEEGAKSYMQCGSSIQDIAEGKNIHK